MKLTSLLRALIVIIIIIGGVIIIIIRGPFPPEPECLVCGKNLLNILGISEVVLGAISFGLVSKINQNINVRQGGKASF